MDNADDAKHDLAGGRRVCGGSDPQLAKWDRPQPGSYAFGQKVLQQQ